MFRLWAKEFKDNRMLRDTVICDDSDETRTHKIFNALEEICYEFDLSKPIWLDVTIAEFKKWCLGQEKALQDLFLDKEYTMTVVSFKDILSTKNNLAPSQLEVLAFPNHNFKFVKDFLTRKLVKSDNGHEVGSTNYISQSPKKFFKAKAL